MNIGLIGLQNSGKTTIFNALTGSQAQVTDYKDARSEPNRAMLKVADRRVGTLSEMYQPKKTTYATIELIDFAGLIQRSAREGVFSGSSAGMIKNADALALVVGHFGDTLDEAPRALMDVEKVKEELLISDLILAELRLERIEKAYARGKRSNPLEMEEKVLRGILDHLNGNRPIREMALDRESEKMIRGFQFLSQKPIMVILNSDETGFAKNQDLVERIGMRYRVIEFAGKFEMELSQLNSQEDVDLFMADMGIRESARDRLCRAAYELLGYISFFTVGADEVRAWSLQKGETVLAAAGSIHTDLARGFIRAACFSYDDLMASGSEKRLGEKGLLRLEGRNYIVEDGNILNIRFNV